MAVLTADQLMDTKYIHSDPQGITQDYQVAASTTIYGGGFVGVDATGGLIMATASASGAALTGCRLVGVALEHVDNSTGLIAAKTCSVLIHGMIKYALTSAVVADVGKPVFLSDDNTLTKVAAGNPCVGWITSFDTAGYVNIMVSPFTQQPCGGLIVGVSPAMDFCTLSDFGLCIHPSYNHNGLIVVAATGYVTEEMLCTDAAGVCTVEGTDGTDVLTLTAVDAMAIGDTIMVANLAIWQECVTDKPVVVVPADYGIQAKITTVNEDATETGAAKIIVAAIAL